MQAIVLATQRGYTIAMSEASQLLEAVRKAAKPAIWSNGVNLARAGAATIESRDVNEIILRVRAPGRPVPWSAILYPHDSEWECDCPSRMDPCEHVVASAITLDQLVAEGSEGPQPVQTTLTRYGRVVYRFTRSGSGLALRRTLARPDGTEVPLEENLVSYLANPAQKAELQVENCDLLVDRVLLRQNRGPLPPERLEGLLQALEPSRTVLLDGRPVAISPEPVVPMARVSDQGGAVEVALSRDPRVTEVVSAGVALCGDALCRLGETAISGSWLQDLPVIQRFSTEQLGDLTTRVLPDLASRFPLEVTSRRIPRIDRTLKPRLVLELRQGPASLTVVPSLVYGSPPAARVEANHLVFLGGAAPLRDPAAEQKLIHQLRDQLNLVPGQPSRFDGPEMVRFADRLRSWNGDLTGDAAAVVRSGAQLRPSLTVVPTSGSGPSQVGFSLLFRQEGSGGEQVEVGAEAVIKAWQEGLGLVPLLGGGWAPLPSAWLEKNGQVVADLLAARGADGKLANHALPRLAQLCDALEQPPPPGFERLAPLVQGFEGLPAAVLPGDLTAILRPYQQEGVDWLAFLRSAGLGGILADDMGLGKTLQALCVLGKGTLVVCPTSVLPNWEKEIARFRPQLRVSTYRGPTRSLGDADITLTSYAILRLDAELLAARSWSAVVLDEAQAIKNPDSQVAQAAFSIPADFRLALSGTPIENRLEELWSVMSFANRGLLDGRREFDRRWAQPVANGDARAAKDLRQRIRPFVLRRLKAEVAPELPERTESILYVDLDEKERALYDGIHAATRAEVVRLLSAGGGVLQALEALLRLRQAACHPALVPGQEARSSSKVRILIESISTAVAEGHKALIFSQWTSLLDLIGPELQQAGIPFERLDGSTRDRGSVVDRFQAPDGPPVLMLSLKAGGTGLNLTAADHVYLVDPWWNPAVEAQAADRAHRIGQTRPVQVHRLVSQGTVEEKILLLQDKKRGLFEAALGEASAAAALTKDDLLDLFR